MSSAGEMLEAYLRIFRVRLDALNETPEEALESVPADYRDLVRARWEEENAQPILRARILSGIGGPRDWFQNWDPSTGYYWRRLRSYLIDQLGRSTAEVESLDDATDTILSHLEDPRPTGPAPFRVQGLVIGYVQSGKTANFSALIAKSADLGYKLVIVLSGIHNTLRQQTQRRLARELGLVTEGVGEPEPGKRWIPLTTSDLHGDFRPGTVSPNVLQGNEQVLLVVKKNASVLRRLVQWMGGRAPSGLPVLIIDDEADQASINTGGNRPPVEELVDLLPDDIDGIIDEDEINPSRINELIRSLIRSFRRVSYVAYTATPFANILINHEAFDREVMEDLYPKDFIVSLPRPHGYVGADRLFGRSPQPGESYEGREGLDVIEYVPDWELGYLVPAAGEVDTFQPRLCESLRTAIFDFVLAIAARAQRSGMNNPASMLIHTHQRTAVQNRLGDQVRAYVRELRQRWRYDKESILPVLRNRWNERFRPIITSVSLNLDVEFNVIEDFIDQLFKDPLNVFVLNSASDDVLDYEANPDLKVILIGGNRLSRGLTLEGLLVSYYVRRTPYFDTLLQMGRWFGFREEYFDLTRLWTTPELAGWFSDLAIAEEELRSEVERYEKERLTPLDFGPRIRRHPVMLVTAPNKMGAARTVIQNYAGKLLQTTRFRLKDRDWLLHNLDATRSFLSKLGSPNKIENGQVTWSGVSWQHVDAFLNNYQTDPTASFIDGGFIRKYLQAQVGLGELVEWRISLRGLASPSAELNGDTVDLHIKGYNNINTIGRTRKKADLNSIGSLINPATAQGQPGTGDEEVGLSVEQILRARERTANGEADSLGEALREERDKREGLLLIYPISRFSRPRSSSKTRLPLFDNPERDGCTVIGVALVFPASKSAATVEYVVGSVGEL